MINIIAVLLREQSHAQAQERKDGSGKVPVCAIQPLHGRSTDDGQSAPSSTDSCKTRVSVSGMVKLDRLLLLDERTDKGSEIIL